MQQRLHSCTKIGILILFFVFVHKSDSFKKCKNYCISEQKTDSFPFSCFTFCAKISFLCKNKIVSRNAKTIAFLNRKRIVFRFLVSYSLQRLIFCAEMKSLHTEKQRFFWCTNKVVALLRVSFLAATLSVW